MQVKFSSSVTKHIYHVKLWKSNAGWIRVGLTSQGSIYQPQLRLGRFNSWGWGRSVGDCGLQFRAAVMDMEWGRVAWTWMQCEELMYDGQHAWHGCVLRNMKTALDSRQLIGFYKFLSLRFEKLGMESMTCKLHLGQCFSSRHDTGVGSATGWKGWDFPTHMCSSCKFSKNGNSCRLKSVTHSSFPTFYMFVFQGTMVMLPVSVWGGLGSALHL